MLIKVCGMTRQSDVDCAARLGFHLCGFIFHSRSPRHVAPEQVASFQSGPMLRVGIFVEQQAQEIITIMRLARLDLAQLHGSQDAACAREIGARRVIRVLWPQRFQSLAELENEVRAHADSCTCYLLEAGLEGGGSGRNLDWKKLASLKTPHPWLLAGGLTAETAETALLATGADGLDFNSGLEDRPGIKNPDKMAAAATVAFGTIKEKP